MCSATELQSLNATNTLIEYSSEVKNDRQNMQIHSLEEAINFPGNKTEERE